MRLEDLLASAALEIVEECAAAGNAPKVDQCRRGSNVLASQAQHLVDASNGMSYVYAEIPQGVEQALGQRANEGVVRVVAQEHDVHVAVQAERQPAVAADRDEGDATTRIETKRSRSRVRSAIQGAQQTIEGARVRMGRGHARVSTAHRVLERPAVSTEVPATGFAEHRCEPT